MFNGTYGTKKPANINSNELEIFWRYSGDRTSGNNEKFKKGNSSWITQAKIDSSENDRTVTKNISGLYNLKLPIKTFNKKGFYTIYIKPKEMDVEIVDVSTLNMYPNIKGIIFSTTDISNMNANATLTNGLVGYRVELLNENGDLTGESRLITSSFSAEPIIVGARAGEVTYTYNSNSNLIFCTVTPSAPLSFNSSSTPNIGSKGSKVKIVNTNFNPVMLEIEMVEHDEDTISTMLEGAQLRNLDSGVITTFTDNGAIYHQANYGNIVDAKNGLHHDFKMPTEGYINSELNNYQKIKDEL